MKKRIFLMFLVLVTLVMVLASCGHDCEFTVDQSLSKAPTCTEEGIEISKCGECDEQQTKILPALDHDWSETTVAPTCTTGGYTRKTCSRCSVTEDINKVDPISHTYVDAPELQQAPTCTEKGYDVEKCTVCGATHKKAGGLPATGHTYVEQIDWANNIEPDCQTAASGWKYEKCSVCGEPNPEVVKTPITYAVGEYPCDLVHDDAHLVEPPTPATCQTVGYSIWQCLVCGRTEKVTTAEKKSCDFSRPGQVIVEATCYRDRVELRTCAYADHTVNNTREEAIPGMRPAHVPNVTNADCATDKYCINCAEHVVGAGVVPTATDFFACPNPNDEYCTFCSFESKIHFYAPATGEHSGGITRTVNPTCMQIGRNYHTCTNMIENGTKTCGFEYSKDEDIIPIDPTAHKYGDTYDQEGGADKINPATCVTYAFKSKTCENCDENDVRCTSQITEEVPSLGYAPHTFTNAEHAGTIICENENCKLALYDSTYSKDVVYETEENQYEDFGDNSELTVTITGTKSETDGSGNPIDTHTVLNKTTTSASLNATAGADGITNNIVVIYIEKTSDIEVTVEVNGEAKTIDANGYVHLNATEIDVTSIELTASTTSDTASAKVYFYSTTITQAVNP